MKRRFLAISILVCWLFLVCAPGSSVKAQTDEITWDPPINLSNSEPTSTDPFLLADPAGVAHLFWAEKAGPQEGNQADTIMYTSWDGITWTRPVDIFFTPEDEGNPKATHPRAVLDENGRIHLVWMTEPNAPNNAVKYSSANAWEAGSASAWQPSVTLAADLTGQKYSIDIGYNPQQGLHLLYARGTGAASGGRSVAYMRSMDGGETWTEPVDIYRISDLKRGASDTRLLLEPPNRIYASWTEWDDSGNGQAIVFTRSLDNGATWERARPLDVTIGLEYERDWNNMALIGDGQIVSIWEGGWRAYRGAMYSYDAGVTWTEPIDVFPWLIGDNGSVEFVRDSNNVLHVFLANRVREGNLNRGERAGLWHSVWEGGTRWREPNLASLRGNDENMTNPKVTIVNGNRIVAAWYRSQVFEIIVMTGRIENAPEIPSSAWVTPTPPLPAGTPVETATPQVAESAGATAIPTNFSNPVVPNNPGSKVLLGLLPSILVVTSIVIIWQRKIRGK